MGENFVKNNEILLVDRHALVMNLLEIKKIVHTFDKHRDKTRIEEKIQKLIDEANK